MFIRKAADMNSKSQSFHPGVWLCLLMMLYVLAVGPAVKFGLKRDSMPSGLRPAGIVGKVWDPLLALDETRARPVYRAYMKLWGVTYYEPDW